MIVFTPLFITLIVAIGIAILIVFFIKAISKFHKYYNIIYWNSYPKHKPDKDKFYYVLDRNHLIPGISLFNGTQWSGEYSQVYAYAEMGKIPNHKEIEEN